MRKLTGIMLFVVCSGVSLLATAGTTHGVPLSRYKSDNVFSAVAFGFKLPSVGSYVLTQGQGASLQYNINTGQYRILVNNSGHPYVNADHSERYGYYFPVSKRSGDKIKSMLESIPKCKKSMRGSPCAVQLLKGKSTMTWSTRRNPYMYAQIVKTVEHPAEVYMRVNAVLFSAGTQTVTVKTK